MMTKPTEGYQPTESHLDPDDPPRGGSGVPPKPIIIKVVVESEESANEVVNED